MFSEPSEPLTISQKAIATLRRVYLHCDPSLSVEIKHLVYDHDWSTAEPDLRLIIRCRWLIAEKRHEECRTLALTYLHSDSTGSSLRFRTIAMLMIVSADQQNRHEDDYLLVSQALEVWQDFTTEEQMALQWICGRLLLHSRRLDKSLQSLDRAKAHALELGAHETYAMINIEAAIAVNDLSDYAGAITMYESSLHTLSRFKAYDSVSVIVRINIAVVYPQVGRNEDALDVYKELLQSVLVIEDRALLLHVRLNMAISYKRLGLNAESLESYTTVLDLAQSTSSVEFQIRALLGLSDLYTIMDNLEQARDCATQALDMAEQSGQDSLRYLSIASLAGVEYESGARTSAIDRLVEAFNWMVQSANSINALEYGRLLVQWCSGEKQFENAFRYQKSCTKIRSTMYAKEIERAVELTGARTRLERERESIRTRDQERNRILNAVLPPSIAERLMNGEKHIADRLPEVTILFADIVGFTKMSSSMGAEDIVLLLEDLFKGMDEIFSTFGCERLKTIGDSYMAICGASEPYPDHVERMCNAALAIGSIGNKLPLDPTRLRIGIHTGPVIAGVMSSARLSFDLWGDTVNVAAQLEGHSSPGKVVCSQAVIDAMANVDGVSFEKSKPLDIKGKGLVETYFLTVS